MDNSFEDNEKINEIKVEYYKKFTIPFVCFVMGLLGIPLGIRKVRGGKSYGFLISLIILIMYYLLLITAESLAKSGEISPIMSMWMPNILMGVLGIYLFINAAKESPPLLFLWLSRVIAHISPRFKRFFLKFTNFFANH